MGAGKRCLPGFVGFGPLRLEQAKLVYGKITLCSKARSAHYITLATQALMSLSHSADRSIRKSLYSITHLLSLSL